MTKQHPAITLTCAHCNKQFARGYGYHKFMTEKYGTRKVFCGTDCKKKSQIFILPDDIVLRYENGESTQDIAADIGVTWGAVRNALLRKGVKLRSKTWHLNTSKNPTKGKGHTDAAKEKIRQSTILQFSDPKAREQASHNQTAAMAAGKISSQSKLEDMVAAELDSRSVEYRRQAPLRDPITGRFFACVDFLLADGRVLEVHGGFWHADPRWYPNGPQKPSQKRTVENDAKKLEKMVELGISVLIVWELDIKSDIKKALSIVLNP
jgi:G:T-mismatch repair DNA endonuclease (very short patch repair protein)